MNRSFQLILFWACATLMQAPLEAASGDKPEPVPATAVLPSWPLAVPKLEPGLPAVRSGDLEVIHARTASGGFLVQVSGHTVGVGAAPSLIGYVKDGDVRWLNNASGPIRDQNVSSNLNRLEVSYIATDPDGGVWQLTRRFRPDTIPGSIEVQTELKVDQNRSVAFLPMLLLFPGVTTFGEAKSQGLFAGLEYLENEPSSSEADVIGPAARRQVPDNLKITFPLMAIQKDDRYVALSWQMRPFFSALYDSPDRQLHSGGHVMGLLFPGSDGQNRQEGSLLPRVAEFVHGGQTVSLRATILGGQGSSVIPAVQQYVRLRPLPPVPGAAGLSQYVAQTAGGWLDSKIRAGALVRHAVAGTAFQPQPAADAAVWMEWLAGRDTDSARALRLRQTSTNVLAAVPPGSLNDCGVGHIRYPVASLVFGDVNENADHAEQAAKELLGRFEPDGGVQYRPKTNGPDYAKTHFAKEASGLASRTVLDLLEAAAFCGNRELLGTAIERVHALDRFHDGIPRGAQTWECPLHTPDLLAAAQMVRAYTLGYELTGDAHFLEEARYWAWTGVPFIYLVSPTDHPVGLYATIPVFGATNWRAPVWLGLPVQWCGLVYADALYRLVRDDPGGPWKRIAEGITASGIQQSWPANDQGLEGLLPDSFVLRGQKRNGPAINPATLEACAAQYFTGSPVCDSRAFHASGLRVCVPGAIVNVQDTKDHARFEIQTWVRHPYFVLVSGLNQRPGISINRQVVPCAAPHQFVDTKGRLILKLDGDVSVDLVVPSK